MQVSGSNLQKMQIVIFVFIFFIRPVFLWQTKQNFFKKRWERKRNKLSAEKLVSCVAKNDFSIDLLMNTCCLCPLVTSCLVFWHIIIDVYDIHRSNFGGFICGCKIVDKDCKVTSVWWWHDWWLKNRQIKVRERQH